MSDFNLNIYNNLIKLTRNKNLYNSSKQDTFYDRMIIFFFHFAFLLKIYKDQETKKNLQKFFDFTVRQIELSIIEIGYGDATINKKMKDYINILYSIIDKIDNWEFKKKDEKIKIFKNYLNDIDNYEYYLNYFEKYASFLSKNTFKNLTKDIITI